MLCCDLRGQRAQPSCTAPVGTAFCSRAAWSFCLGFPATWQQLFFLIDAWSSWCSFNRRLEVDGQFCPDHRLSLQILLLPYPFLFFWAPLPDPDPMQTLGTCTSALGSGLHGRHPGVSCDSVSVVFCHICGGLSAVCLARCPTHRSRSSRHTLDLHFVFLRSYFYL